LALLLIERPSAQRTSHLPFVRSLAFVCNLSSSRFSGWRSGDRETVDMADSDLLVLMPRRSEISPQTRLALLQNMDGLPFRMLEETGRPVDEARNALAARALEACGSDTLCLWIDDDCYWCAGTVELLISTFRKHADVDVLTAYFGPRAPFATPLCLLRPNDVTSAPREGRDFRVGEIVPIASASMNCVLHRAALLREAGPEPFSPLPGSLGEDHSFFERLRALGRRTALATGIVVAHCEGDLAFVPGRRPFCVVDNRLQLTDDPRSDAEIAAAYAGRNLRRSYGPAVDAL
jgi:hypothetical protein